MFIPFTKFRLAFAEQGVDESILRMLNLKAADRNLTRWTEMLTRMKNPKSEVSIGLVGKYVEYEDSYKSLKEACCMPASPIRRASISNGSNRKNGMARLPRLFPALRWHPRPRRLWQTWYRRNVQRHPLRREEKIPYFGICLGMQTMVIEFARNVCGFPEADSTEFNPTTPHRVIYKLRELKGVDELGGTAFRRYLCRLAENSFAQHAYGATDISERHRHRYEFNREF